MRDLGWFPTLALAALSAIAIIVIIILVAEAVGP